MINVSCLSARQAFSFSWSLSACYVSQSLTNHLLFTALHGPCDDSNHEKQKNNGVDPDGSIWK